MVQKILGLKKFWVQKKFEGSIGPNKVCPKKFDKKNYWLPKLCPKSLVKIGSVTAGTNVARTNVAWKNVTVTIGIWSKLVK